MDQFESGLSVVNAGDDPNSPFANFHGDLQKALTRLPTNASISIGPGHRKGISL
jgi:hypothetical protein